MKLWWNWAPVAQWLSALISIPEVPGSNPGLGKILEIFKHHPLPVLLDIKTNYLVPENPPRSLQGSFNVFFQTENSKKLKGYPLMKLQNVRQKVGKRRKQNLEGSTVCSRFFAKIRKVCPSWDSNPRALFLHSSTTPSPALFGEILNLWEFIKVDVSLWLKKQLATVSVVHLFSRSAD